jgi:rhodanese-related sulfurtransferase
MATLLKHLFGPRTDFRDLLRQGAVIVDVRTPGEYRDGHIEGSVNIPVDRLRDHLPELKKKPCIITCCASGMRSATVAGVLKAAGCSAVYNGGGWMSLRNKIR